MDHRLELFRALLLSSLAVAGFAVAPDANGQAIVIDSSRESISGAPSVSLQGFEPDAEVEVRFIRTAPDGLPPAFSASARYRVGPDGSVDVSSVPLSGDWQAAVPEAPFWSMREDPAAPIPSPGIVLIEARSKEIRARAEYRLPESRSIVTERIDAFAGAFLVRPADADGPLPLIIILGGSEGDDRTARQVAPRLAAEGYAALGLPYLSPDRGRGQAIPGLPSLFSEIPVDRLEKVHQWAVQDRRVDASRIGLWGQSKGAEFALIAAAHFAWVDAVVAIVPSDVVWEGFGYGGVVRTGTSSFSLRGKPLPFVPYADSGRTTPEKQTGRWKHPERAANARIRIERFEGHLLVAGGEQDPSWDSAGMSQAIAERRAEHGQRTTSLIFADAGHGLAGDPLAPADARRGGTLEGNGRARLAIWIATRELFRAAWPFQKGSRND